MLHKDGTKLTRRKDSAVWSCPDWPECDHYVSCHPGTTLPTGTLANKTLRRERYSTHCVFDLLWSGGKLARNRAYQELGAAMGLSEEQCHIGLFTFGQLEEAKAFARRRLRELYKEPKSGSA